MDALVGPADVADLPGGPALSMATLQVAGEDIRGYCGWHISPTASTTCEVSGSGSPRLVLPSLRVVEVVQVVDVERGGPIEGWRVLPGGMLYRAAGWPRGDHNLQVQMRHGYDLVPSELLAAVLALAEAVGDVSVGVRSETDTVDDVTRSRVYFAESIRSGSSGLPPAMQAVLDRHRVTT